jgi:hypothetical protein
MISKLTWLSVPLASIAVALWSPAVAQTPRDCGVEPLTVSEHASASLDPDCLAPRGGKPILGLGAGFGTWKTVTLGTYRGVERLREDFDQAKLSIGDAADEVLGRPGFAFASERIEVDLVILSGADLGFDAAASLAEVHARAQQFGFWLCPPEVGPQLRLQYRDQPVGEFLHVAMRPLKSYAGRLVEFTVGNGGAGLVLVGGERSADIQVSPIMRFVFVRPR